MATIFGTAGEDFLHGTNSADTLYGLRGDDYIRGRMGADLLFGGLNGDRLDGGAGNDTAHGEGGHDWLVGGAGSDALFGDGGNDTLVEGEGADSMYGGIGNDLFFNTSQQDQSADVFDGGDGVDKLYTYADVYEPTTGWQHLAVRVNLLAGTLKIGDFARDAVRSIEIVQTGDGDDAINGSTVAERIEVGSGSNVVYSGGGDDTLIGGSFVAVSGGERLNGGSGNDLIDGGGAFIHTSPDRYELAHESLAGGAGDDTIKSNASLVTISGGEGHDEFQFDTGLGNIGNDYAAVQATIVDYESGETIMVLPENLEAPLQYVGETDDPEYLKIGYYRDGGDTVITANTGPDAVYALTIRLSDYTGPLSASDFDLG